MTAERSDNFYAGLKPFARFADVLDLSRYRPLPADWHVGTADVVNSTGAIAEGRYKAVNMVGASVISAALNDLEGMSFPFVFGGDGAALAVPASGLDRLQAGHGRRAGLGRSGDGPEAARGDSAAHRNPATPEWMSRSPASRRARM